MLYSGHHTKAWRARNTHLHTWENLLNLVFHPGQALEPEDPVPEPDAFSGEKS